jgi:hypothetical protein
MMDKGIFPSDDELKICGGCKLFFDKVKKTTGMCRNCHKIFTKAEAIADTFDGFVDFNTETTELTLTCKNAHMWAVAFVPRAITGGTLKQVKYWCVRCERSERDTRKAFHREQEAEKQREL